MTKVTSEQMLILAAIDIVAGMNRMTLSLIKGLRDVGYPVSDYNALVQGLALHPDSAHMEAVSTLMQNQAGLEKWLPTLDQASDANDQKMLGRPPPATTKAPPALSDKLIDAMVDAHDAGIDVRNQAAFLDYLEDHPDVGVYQEAERLPKEVLEAAIQEHVLPDADKIKNFPNKAIQACRGIKWRIASVIDDARKLKDALVGLGFDMADPTTRATLCGEIAKANPQNTGAAFLASDESSLSRLNDSSGGAAGENRRLKTTLGLPQDYKAPGPKSIQQMSKAELEGILSKVNFDTISEAEMAEVEKVIALLDKMEQPGYVPQVKTQTPQVRQGPVGAAFKQLSEGEVGDFMVDYHRDNSPLKVKGGMPVRNMSTGETGRVIGIDNSEGKKRLVVQTDAGGKGYWAQGANIQTDKKKFASVSMREVIAQASSAMTPPTTMGGQPGMQAPVAPTAPMTPGAPEDVPKPGDMVKPPDGAQVDPSQSGQVLQVAPDGKVMYQTQDGQQKFKDPGQDQFQVVKPG